MLTLRCRHRALGNALHATVRCASTSVAAPKPLTSILIANRGEIALRVARTADTLGIRTTTLYTSPDARSQHAISSPFAINLGDDVRAYLDAERIVEIARKEGCGGIHPGYGFLSENAEFARMCTDAGLTFIGPPWEAIEAMGNKSRSKEIMNAAGVPCIPGYHGSDQTPERLAEEAANVGYPVLIKAVKGGGGKGMRIVRSPSEFDAQLESARSEARNAFGDDAVLVERYIGAPRHIEVQVFADAHGNCVALGERDCSVQRRHQKVLEESPAPDLHDRVRKDIWDKARKAALAVGYRGAGTVEFIFDNDSGEFFFMEMNTRLQVEHPVTEMVTGEDLVGWQIAVAEGAKLPLTQEEVEKQIAERGAAIEARIYAENPDMNFMPDSGPLLHVKTPTPTPDLRIDAGFVAGDTVSAHYDPMIAKLIVRGPTRAAALQRLSAALEEYEIAGPATNVEFLKRVCASPAFAKGAVETGFIEQNRDQLFAKTPIPAEALSQAAIGMVLLDCALAESDSPGVRPGEAAGFGAGFQEREIRLVETAPAGDEAKRYAIGVRQTAPGRFKVAIADQVFEDIAAEYDVLSRILTGFYPHTRLSTTVVRSPDGDSLMLFQRGKQYKFRIETPTWLAKALGKREGEGESVKSPMPCKVLRVDVGEGDQVEKGQVLVVVESMKMEMAIRSPRDGTVAKVVHQAGDLCKAGTTLVEFAEG